MCVMHIFLDGYCSTVQGLLDWVEVDLGFTELLFIQIDLCVMCVFVLYSPVCVMHIRFVSCSLSLISFLAKHTFEVDTYLAYILVTNILLRAPACHTRTRARVRLSFSAPPWSTRGTGRVKNGVA